MQDNSIQTSEAVTNGIRVLVTSQFSHAVAQGPASDWVVPRTANGHPDLQGNWTNVTVTPFLREEGKGPLFTWDEVAQLEGRAAARVERGARASDPDRAPPSAGCWKGWPRPSPWKARRGASRSMTTATSREPTRWAP